MCYALHMDHGLGLYKYFCYYIMWLVSRFTRLQRLEAHFLTPYQQAMQKLSLQSEMNVYVSLYMCI